VGDTIEYDLKPLGRVFDLSIAAEQEPCSAEESSRKTYRCG